jgi:TetR/AcrR family transcriptional repressor of nem operon
MLLVAMPRTKEFDRDSAVKTAIAVFRANGYQGTTTDDLRHAIGIGRQSLYDTFGGKKPLYLEALRRYNDQRLALFTRLIADAPSALDGITEVLVATARETAHERSLRCLGVEAVSTFSDCDAEVSAVVNLTARAMNSLFRDVVARAKAEGKLRKSLDVDEVVRLVNCVLLGLRVAARGGAPPAELRSIAKTLVSGLCGKETAA